MSGYGSTDWKGCFIFILLIPILIISALVEKIKTFIWSK